MRIIELVPERCSVCKNKSKYHVLKIKNKEQIINNCVNPRTGLHVFNCAFKNHNLIEILKGVSNV